MTESTKKSYKTMGFLMPGCMFIGMGVGFLLGDVRSGLFIGMGTGFLLAGIFTLKTNNQENQ